MSGESQLISTSFNENTAVLNMSSQTIFRHVPFSIEFSAPPLWLSQNSIRPEDILYAGLRMRVLKVRTTDEVKECTICSKGRKVIEVGVSSNQKFLEGKIVNGRQVFTFDKCRSNCSSSRNHHKDQLFLSLDLNNTLSISSQPFSIRSRVLTPKSKDRNEKPISKKVDQKVLVVCVEGEQLNLIEQIKNALFNEPAESCKAVIKKYSDVAMIYIHVNEDIAESIQTKINEITNSIPEAEKQSAFVMSSLQ
ncbi:hypothetical protein EDI_275410 [Entamoeba dispar SAW760]|uniref:Uncharacterized protein n=1 Tax=Entamoeba dispar (strain ATCC PRA-260 / SAW760) TaxID=370354 RepID=B0EKH8_ENTDS|nr:uncharacterized protein EDI_275410 [Entamoeba dispar SAW760]EDR24968.1 hypothetical protein EDI_275410 [Entamoeba dispar SAW760]|eukprot:EDR24968.1 hypothetical protein EDI_275410 [Entamoeba dispar SAW760]